MANNTVGPIGRCARLVLGVGLAVITVPVYLVADQAYVIASVGLVAALTAIYVGLHLALSRYGLGGNRWVLSLLAAAPVFLTWLLGQGGGPLFGSGEGGTAALTYLTVSFLIDAARGNGGCEVMAVPALMFGRRTHLPCLLLCAIDHAEGTLDA